MFCSWFRDFLCRVNSTLNYDVQCNALSFAGAKQCLTGSGCSGINLSYWFCRVLHRKVSCPVADKFDLEPHCI